MNNNVLDALRSRGSVGNTPADSEFMPKFYVLPNDEKALNEVINKPGVRVFDTIQNQLEELLKSRNVSKKLSGERLNNAIKEHLNGRDSLTYGVWVFYPWNGNLVHILPESEFIELRTSRNQYKITKAEQELLQTKKVGVIGLSVGQSVSLTMAMERGFGELRIADFDMLELTNLNRIRTGIHNLGISKVTAVAREIKEIDPFLKVTPFFEGITANNLDAFLTEGGKLDLLIDECDGLDIKVLARYKAKELSIPVLMEASDRATVDVERFDLEPNRPILHGLIEGLDPVKLASLKTNDEKVPYMLAMVGLDTVSTRIKASMIEVGESISTWPQLASAVVLGGGVTADVARRIFLNQFRQSGRYHVDLDELIGEGQDSFEITQYEHDQPGEIKEEWKEIARKQASHLITLNKETVDEILHAAHAAPSGGNLQPWVWIHCGSSFSLFRKTHLSYEFLDHNLAATWVSLGASIENAVLAMQKAGLHAEVKLFPRQLDDVWVAQIEVKKLEVPNAYEASNQKLELFHAIHQRHTNRNIEPSAPIESHELDYLKKSVETMDMSLSYFSEGAEKGILADCLAGVERIRMLNKGSYHDYMKEIRWTDEEARSTGDGIDLATCDLTPTDIAGFQIARHRIALDLIEEWGLGKSLETLSYKATDAAPVLAMLHGPSRGTEAYLNGGRALERVWIAANQIGLCFQPQSPITLLIDRIRENRGLSARELNELKTFHDQIMRLTSAQHPEPIFIFRLFKGNKAVTKSYRRSPQFHLSSIG